MDERLAARVAAWKDDADDRIVEAADWLIKNGRAMWVWDPEYDDVAGLLMLDRPGNAAAVVIYADGDWEHDYDILS